MPNITVKEYADLKGISESTVKNHIHKNQLTAIKEDGKYLIPVKSSRRVIPQEEKTLRAEVKHLKKENKRLEELKAERDQAFDEIKDLRNKVDELNKKLRDKNEELRNKNEELHERIHTINEKKDEYFASMYNELKGLKLAQKPHIEDED